MVEVLGGGTAIGIEELRDKEIDLAAVSWKADDEEAPDDLNVVPIAHDSLAIIVNPQNTITNVTSLQLRALYRGETLDWGAVGGSGGEHHHDQPRGWLRLAHGVRGAGDGR